MKAKLISLLAVVVLAASCSSPAAPEYNPLPAYLQEVSRGWSFFGQENYALAATSFRNAMEEAGLAVGGTTHVVPLCLGEIGKAMAVNRMIFEQGILASPITPPLVPVKRSGIRFVIMATHTREHLERAVEVVVGAGKAAGVI